MLRAPPDWSPRVRSSTAELLGPSIPRALACQSAQSRSEKPRGFRRSVGICVITREATGQHGHGCTTMGKPRTASSWREYIIIRSHTRHPATRAGAPGAREACPVDRAQFLDYVEIPGEGKGLTLVAAQFAAPHSVETLLGIISAGNRVRRRWIAQIEAFNEPDRYS